MDIRRIAGKIVQVIGENISDDQLGEVLKERDVVYEYIHMPVGSSRVTLAIEQIDKKTAAVAMAFCSPRDQFCRKKGRSIASGRLRGRHNVVFVTFVPDTYLGMKGHVEQFVRSYLCDPANKSVVPSWARVDDYCSTWIAPKRVVGDQLRCVIGIEQDGKEVTGDIYVTRMFLESMVDLFIEWKER